MFFSTAPSNQTKSDLKACPHCNKSGKNVGETTIKAQLNKAKRETMQSNPDELIFCKTPGCDVVYYSAVNDELFFEADIKSKVTIKNDDPSTPLCYCHKYKKQDALEDMKVMAPLDLVKKIKGIISKDKSFCQKANPKGSCCTEDIKSFLASHKIPWENPLKLKPAVIGTK